MKNEWDLYDGHSKYPLAVQAIERAWQEAIRLAPDKPTKARALLAEKHVYDVLQKWSDVGACDTEPVWVLRDRIRKHFGCDGGWL